MPKLIRKRVMEEWGEPDGWTVHITFVAHDAFAFETQAFEIEGVNVTIDFTTFEAITDQVDLVATLDSIRQLVWEPLNDFRTPDSVRDWYLQAIGHQ